MFSEEKLAEIRERLSISDLVAEYVQLKKAGKNYKGLCPFHSERTPSFIVSPERETFHCFGCSTGGNLFHFLMKIENLSFPEAVERLADRTGVPLEKTGPADPAQRQRRDKALEIQRQAAWYYHCLLKKTSAESPVWAYLHGRQISPEMVTAFHLGYCPPSDSGLRQHLRKKGFSSAEIEGSSLYRGEREFFRGRILFPIFRADKKVVGLGGRLFAEKDMGPKYLNSPESEIFKKGDLFFGMPQARAAIREQQRVMVAEGYLDVITLHSHGFRDAVAPLGTAFTPHHAKVLHRLGAKILLLFDGDSAGQEASKRALEALLGQGAFPQWVPLESSEDPDSYLRRYGRLAFEKLLLNQRNLLEELIDKSPASALAGPGQLEQKAQAARRLMGLIEKIPDGIVKNLYVRRLSERLEIPESWLKAERYRGADKKPLAKPPSQAPSRPAWLPEEEVLLEVWLKFPPLRAVLSEALRVEDFLSEPARVVAQFFWEHAADQAHEITGKYFDLAPDGFLEVLSELTLRKSNLEDISTAQLSLEEAILRLKEKRLRHELKVLQHRNQDEAVPLGMIQEKIQALSQLLKNKERVYGERKS